MVLGLGTIFQHIFLVLPIEQHLSTAMSSAKFSRVKLYQSESA